MENQIKNITRVNLKVPTDLYTEYKIALLQRYPRRNVTQDLIAYMRHVVDENKRLNATKQD